MKKSLMILGLLALTNSASAQIAISEVFEGTSGNLKYVELHNTTGSSIDLAAGGWVLSRIANANPTGSDINLSGTIAAGDYFVVANNATNFNTDTFGFDADQYSTTITHNGNDKYTLSNTGGLVDSFAGDLIGGSATFAADVVAFRVKANFPNNGDWGTVIRGGGSPSGNWSSVTVTASNGNATSVGTPGTDGGDGGSELPVTLQSFSVE